MDWLTYAHNEGYEATSVARLSREEHARLYNKYLINTEAPIEWIVRMGYVRELENGYWRCLHCALPPAEILTDMPHHFRQAHEKMFQAYNREQERKANSAQ